MKLLIFLFSLNLYASPWGKDADICSPKCKTSKERLTPLQNFGKILIKFHQDVISPIDGPRSHFRPSSSQYMMDAIKKYGFFSGIPVGCDRLLRENSDPWVYPTVPFDRARLKWDSVDGSWTEDVLPFEDS